MSRLDQRSLLFAPKKLRSPVCSVGPYDRPDLWIKPQLPKKLGISEWFEYGTRELWFEVDFPDESVIELDSD